jgi:chromosome segregation ATPase
MTTLIAASLIALALGGGCGFLFVRLLVSDRLKTCELRLKRAVQECHSLRQQLQDALLSEREALAEKEAATARAVKAEAECSDALARLEQLTGELHSAQNENADLTSNMLRLESQEKSKDETLARQKATIETFLFRGAKLIQEFVMDYVH